MSKLARLLMIVFLAAFAAGTAAHAAAATDMSLEMSMASMEDGGMVGCQDCPGGEGQASACEQFCVSTLAALSTPAATALPISAEPVAILPSNCLGGRTGPPDPYPPRTIL
jgi:hypothetical protein